MTARDPRAEWGSAGGDVGEILCHEDCVGVDLLDRSRCVQVSLNNFLSVLEVQSVC